MPHPPLVNWPMALEPVAGQVYFAAECHRNYEALGFAPSPHTSASGVQMPDGPAYFTSRGSVMGQVPGELVAAAFAVFNPGAVIPAVAWGWTKCDATTICAARTEGATAQLVRILGDEPAGLARATELLTRATADLKPEGRPLYAGLVSLGLPGHPVADMWRLADLLREYRGDAHTAAWVSAGLTAPEIGLLSELYWGLPMKTYVRTRAWSDRQLDEAHEHLFNRGLIAEDAFSARGRELREAIEVSTDRQCEVIEQSLGDDMAELIGLLTPWGAMIRQAGGYPPQGPHDLARRRKTGELIRRTRRGRSALRAAPYPWAVSILDFLLILETVSGWDPGRGSHRPVFGPTAGGDEQRPSRIMDPGGVPHVRRVDHRFAGMQRDDLLARVEVLHHIDPTGQQDHHLLARRVALPGVPGCVLLDDAHQSALVPVRSGGHRVAVHEGGRPLEVGDGHGPAPQAEVDEGLAQIEGAHGPVLGGVHRLLDLNGGGTSWPSAECGSPTGPAPRGRRASRCPDRWPRPAGRWPAATTAPCGW